MKFLTYNVSWEGLEGKDTAGAKGSKCLVDGKNKCLENVTALLKGKNYDYICLQEAAFPKDYNYGLPEYNYKWAKQGNETLMTFYRKGNEPEKVFWGELSITESGRPFLICVFKDIVVVNIHAPHNWSMFAIFRMIDAAFKKENAENMLDRSIVIAGDFNMDIGKTMTGLCRKFTSEPIHVATCCDANFGAGGETAYFGSFDHFLISPSLKFDFVGTVKNGKDNILYSDHLPLMAEIIRKKKKGKGRTRRKGNRGTSRVVRPLT